MQALNEGTTILRSLFLLVFDLLSRFVERILDTSKLPVFLDEVVCAEDVEDDQVKQGKSNH